MHEIVFLLVSRNIGGLERRFSTLYRHFADTDPDRSVEFWVSRALVDQLQTRYPEPSGQNLRLVPFGVAASWSQRLPKLEPLWRAIDYAALAGRLLARRRMKKAAAAHFVTPSSLFFRKLLRAKRRVVSSVDSSGAPRTKSFTSALSEGFHVDNLSPDIARENLERGLADTARLHVAPCSFVDTTSNRPADKLPAVVFMSRLIPLKGLDLLLEALPTLMTRCPDITVQILGDGPLRQTVEDAVAGEPWTSRVRVAFEPEPHSVLRRSLIFLSLQDVDNYPSQSLLEAMACGNAIIATDVGNTRRLVDEDVGILVTKSPSELVDAVMKLASDSDDARARGQRARERVLQCHSAERFAEYLFGIYESD